MSSIIFITIYTIIGYIIQFGGIFLTKFFTDKSESRKPYTAAILVNVIWFLIMFFVLNYINSLITNYLFTIGAAPDLITFASIINSVIILLINMIVIALLIRVFYKTELKDSIFISLALISVQVFFRIVVANVLSIIFNLTTGGTILLYPFQYL